MSSYSFYIVLGFYYFQNCRKRARDESEQIDTNFKSESVSEGEKGEKLISREKTTSRRGM